MSLVELRDAATRVLDENWTGRSTVPSRSLYPHQWSWDSAFIAIGLRHAAPQRAQIELESLFASQWQDGRIPHINFSPSVPRDAYFPGPDFWQASTPGGVETSGIVQPPVHALAVWLTHQADEAESVRRDFLAGLYPKLVAWHAYLRERRDLGGRGLVSVVHPWESGMDNSPAWDEALARVEPAPPDTVHPEGHRACQRHRSADGPRLRTVCPARRDVPGPWLRRHSDALRVRARRSVLQRPADRSEHALASIAEELSLDPAPHLNAAAELTTALERLFANGNFHARDLHDDRLVGADTVSGLVPLLVPELRQVEELLATARGPKFQLGQVKLVPSYDLTGPAFDRSRYWRGPSWFNTAWVIHRGLAQLGYDEAAGVLRDDVLALAAETTFAEYVDPFTGAARGARDFSWTAALTLDLLRST